MHHRITALKEENQLLSVSLAKWQVNGFPASRQFTDAIQVTPSWPA
jgi:hypothetical protein